MIKKLMTAVMLSVLSIGGNAAVILKIPQQIKVENIDGQPVKSGLFRSKADQFQLKAGAHQLDVIYYQYFDAENGIGSHDIVRSAQVTMHTPILQDQQAYTLALLPIPDNHQQAKAFAQQPTFALYNSKNELLMVQTGVANTTNNSIKAFFSEQNKNHQDMAQPQAIYTSLAKLPMPESNSNQPLAESSSLHQLILMWKGASKEEQKKFMLWLLEQEN